MFLSQDRKNDIKKRGKNCLVYNIDGKKVRLSKANVWLDNKGNYYIPIEVSTICNSCVIC